MTTPITTITPVKSITQQTTITRPSSYTTPESGMAWVTLSMKGNLVIKDLNGVYTTRVEEVKLFVEANGVLYFRYLDNRGMWQVMYSVKKWTTKVGHPVLMLSEHFIDHNGEDDEFIGIGSIDGIDRLLNYEIRGFAFKLF